MRSVHANVKCAGRRTRAHTVWSPGGPRRSPRSLRREWTSQQMLSSNEAHNRAATTTSRKRRCSALEVLRKIGGWPWPRIGAACAGVLGIAAIVLSPLWMQRLFQRTSAVDWTRLSNIGQTYGFISAILSAVAVVGVAASLSAQTRQTKIDQLQLLRQVHGELLDYAIIDPKTYAPVLGDFGSASDEDIRRKLLSTLWLNYFFAMFETGGWNERGLRLDGFRELFQSEIARTNWQRARPAWQIYRSQNRSGRNFLRIADEEYDRALRDARATVDDRGNGVDSPHKNAWDDKTAAPPPIYKMTTTPGVVALGLGVGLGYFLGRLHERRRLPRIDGRAIRGPRSRRI
ncbi:DUF6082 family protein [Actinoplanes sp. NPDC049265]|uniref:DUF6082 family protein n=1 Tax=Actinoplanes sp. NPDC049265 TaxID=3363902 RepID=UPI00371B79CF